MQREQAIAILKAHAAELRARGVIRLALFGSLLVDDVRSAREDNDIDLLVDLDPEHELSLVDFVELRLHLSDILGREVDLVLRDRLKPHLREAILAEARDVL